MKKIKIEHIIVAIILLLLLSGVTIFLNNNSLKGKLKERDTIIEALTDSLKIQRNKDSSMTARILAFEAQSTKDFLKIKSQEEDITRLQALVQKYKNDLKKSGSATVIGSETDVDDSSPTIITRVDTLYKDSLIYLYPEYKSNINLQGWVVGTSIANKDTTKLNIKIKNEYDVVIGRNNKKLYAEVTSHNPHTTINTVRTYSVKAPPAKKFGLGVHLGYGVGFTPLPTLTPVASIGINYNIIEF